tara:strand:+ start:386 stop:2263 length:1878 start_codon:yes stop_codon:yes gene_type:complete
MMNRKEFKNLLTEWGNLVSNNLLLEISRNDVVEVIGEDDYNILKQNRKASQDQNFLKVIINTYKAGQAHSITDILGVYQSYIRFIASRWNRGESADIDVPGGLRASLEPDSTTYDSMLEFIDAASSMTLKSKAFIKCLEQDDINSDFEVVLNDSEWIICYPKTIKGSISLARSFWNGERLEYDKTVSGGVGQHIGRMGWCTSSISGGNMFLNYHRQMNLHLYYCIKKNTSVEEPDRKLCISFVKNDGEVSLKATGWASVDADNNSIDEKGFRKYIGRRFNDLLEDAKKPERLEIDIKSYYESISLEQYKTLRAANEDTLEQFAHGELYNIIQFSKDKHKIILLALEEENPKIRFVASKHNDLLNLDPTGNLIVQLSQDTNPEVRKNVVRALLRPESNKLKQKDELIKTLSQDRNENVRAFLASVTLDKLLLDQLLLDKSPEVRAAIASRGDLSNLDPSGELVRQLAQDKDEKVRLTLIKYSTKIKAEDIPDDVFRQLVQDENHEIRYYLVAKYYNQLPDDVLRQLAQDESFQIRQQIAYKKDISDDLIIQFAQDKSHFVRIATVGSHGHALLELDPKLIEQLAQDENEFVRLNTKPYYDLLLRYPELYKNESILRKYIKHYIIKG